MIVYNLLLLLQTDLVNPNTFLLEKFCLNSKTTDKQVHSTKEIHSLAITYGCQEFRIKKALP